MTSPLPKEINEESGRYWKDLPIVKLINLFLKKWWILLICGVVAGVIGILYAGFQRPKFESRLTFSLDAGSNEGGLSAAMSLAAQFGIGFGSGTSMFDGDNILEIMKSRRIVESVLLSCDTFESKEKTFIQYYMESTGLAKAFSKDERLKNIIFPCGVKKSSLSYLQDSVLYNVYLAFSTENIVATRPDRKLSIYEVKIISLNERFSKVYTDKLVQETINFYTEIASKKDKETLEILEQRVSALKGNVGSSIDIRANTQDANVNPAFAQAQTPLLKKQYDMQAYGEAYKEMFKTLEMARYQYLKKIPLLQIIDQADYPMKKIKVGKLKTGILFSIFTILFAMIAIWISDIIKRNKNFES